MADGKFQRLEELSIGRADLHYAFRPDAIGTDEEGRAIQRPGHVSQLMADLIAGDCRQGAVGRDKHEVVVVIDDAKAAIGEPDAISIIFQEP